MLGIETFTVAADSPLPAGDQEVRAHFAYDGGGIGKGGTVTLFTGDTKIGEGRVERTMPFMFSMDETADVGSDAASPVSDRVRPGRQRVHRHHRVGAHRPRRRRPRPPRSTDEHKMAVAMMRQ